MLLSLRLGFTRNLANHILDVVSPTPFHFTQKLLIKLCINALLKKGKHSTPTTMLSQKNKRNSETSFLKNLNNLLRR